MNVEPHKAETENLAGVRAVRGQLLSLGSTSRAPVFERQNMQGTMHETVRRVTSPTFELKTALADYMGACASHSNRVVALKRLADSGVLTEAQFMQVIEQHPSTIDRDLANAREEFQRAKDRYEKFCADNNEVAYATYSED